LEQLKKEAATLDTKITELEKELAALDTTKDEKIRMVVVELATPAPFKSYIQVQGRVDADENVSLASETGGAISRIYVKVGDEVSVGKIL
ncbi:hypothetical protein ACI3PL_23075, partial [Lacticaseibacillus paracasei]